MPKTSEARLAETFQKGGAQAVLLSIMGRDTPDERRELIWQAHREIGKPDGHRGDLDGYVILMRAGFDEILAQAQLESLPGTAAKLKDEVNMLSYNFSAALAQCWPEDGYPRRPWHFQQGLLAANRCLAWRAELGKGPKPFSIAYWAKGVHELSLGSPVDAALSFARSVEAARLAATEGAVLEIEPGGDFFFVLGEGYRGLAMKMAGEPEGSRLFEAAVRAFDVQKEQCEGEAFEDASIGAAQLRCIADRIQTKAD